MREVSETHIVQRERYRIPLDAYRRFLAKHGVPLSCPSAEISTGFDCGGRGAYLHPIEYLGEHGDLIVQVERCEALSETCKQ